MTIYKDIVLEGGGQGDRHQQQGTEDGGGGRDHHQGRGEAHPGGGGQ